MIIGRTGCRRLALALAGLALAAVMGGWRTGHAAGQGEDGGTRNAGSGGVGAAADSVPADSSAADAPAIFLSWGAPHGMPGARESITAACVDTTSSDTLYVTFDPGRYHERLIGVDAMLAFRPATWDTLGPFWDAVPGSSTALNLRAEFTDPPPGCPSAWPVTGMGMSRYRREPDSGRMLLTYFVPASRGRAVEGGTRYFFARVIVRHGGRAGGCSAPVCVELVRLKPSYGAGSAWITDGERFVSRNSRGGTVCAEHRLRPPEEPPRRTLPADSTKR